MSESDGLRTAGNYLIDVTDKTMATITIPEGVTDIMAYAFAECQDLSSVIVKGTVTSLGEYVFDGCDGLPYMEFPSLQTIKDYALANMDSLVSMDFWEGLVSIGNHVFENDVLLESVTIPSTVTNVGEYVFANCPKLESVILGLRTPIEINENVFMEETYANCTLFVPRGTKEIYLADTTWGKFQHIEEFDYEFLSEVFLIKQSDKSSDNKIVKCNDKDIESCTIQGYQAIGAGAFAKCEKLQTVVCSSSVSYIGSAAYYQCISLTSIFIVATNPVIEPYAFYGCLNLGRVKMGASIPPQIDESVFEGCYRNCILLVPRGSKEAYASTYPWSLFYRIDEYDLETDPEDIEVIEGDATTIIDHYNVNGQRMDASHKGLNILKMSDGTVKKLFVK